MKREFLVKFYRLKETGERRMLVPMWVNRSPEYWIKIKGMG